MIPASEQIMVSPQRTAHRVAVALVVLQFWVLAAYAVTGPLAYYWPAMRYPTLRETVPEWLLVLPELVLGAPGFWIVVFSVGVGIACTVAGAVVLAIGRRLLSTRLAAWLWVGTLLHLAVVVFSLTPAGRDVSIWVAD